MAPIRSRTLSPARLRAGTLGLAAVLALAGTALPARSEPGYRDLGPAILSRPNGYDYAYAPSILREGGTWHMVFCSTGAAGGWDWIRHASSADGRTWSAPEAILRVSDLKGERAACDPALVRYQAPGDPTPFYYLFYTGSPEGVGGAIFVARAAGIEGPYAKWNGAAWVIDAREPRPVLTPAVPHPDKAGFYGAGQSSVVVKDGRLHAWFTDDTTCPGRSCNKIFASTTDTPTHWPSRTPTNLDGLSSVDVKVEEATGRFVLWAVTGPHTFSSYLLRFVSTDGVTWSRPEIAVGPTAFTHYAHNVGVAGDAAGHLLAGDTLVAFGAPIRANPDCGICWARWDLQTGLIGRAPAGPPRP